MKHIPIIGDKYGYYTVISDTIKLSNDNKRCFEVQCSCGKIEFKLARNLKNGRCISCKSCSSKRTASNYPPPSSFKGIGDLGATYFSKLRSSSIVRGFEFEITIEYAWNLLVQQNFKCKLSSLPINLTSQTSNSNPDYYNFTASLDRIDNTKGYIEGNVQWVHKDINRMKHAFDQAYFIKLCKAIANFN